MYKYISILAFYLLSSAKAIDTADAIAAAALANEPLLVSTVILGTSIYETCILIKPITPSQNAKCATEYGVYLVNLGILHYDLTGVHSVLTKSLVDPHAGKPYDVCLFDISNLILFEICGG